MKKNIEVIDVNSNQILKTFSIEESEQAYEYAKEMEEYGIDVTLSIPTIADTLISSLGLSIEDQEKLSDSMHDEIADHEGSCCVKDEDQKE